jgi:outer membrane protein assembly factor BamA
VALVACVCARAIADEPKPSSPEWPSGRVPRKSEARDDALAVPRLVLSLPRNLFRALSYPIRGTMVLNERYQIYQHVVDALTSKDGRVGVRLALDFALDYQPMFGLSFFDERAFGAGTAVYAKAETGGPDLVVASALAKPLRAGRRVALDVEAAYLRRDDQIFRAIPSLRTIDRGNARFAQHSADLWLRPKVRATRDLTLGLIAQLGFRRFADGRASGSEGAIASVYCVRALGRACVPGTVDERDVPGFNAGTQFARAGATLRLDTFDRPTKPSAGAQLDLAASYTHGLGDPSSYARAAAQLSVVVNLWQRSHVLVVRGRSELVLPTSSAEVPFTELATLGGPDSLRGFRLGRFRDYSTLLVSAEYRWPIWMWADAMLFVDYGGAAGRLYSGLDGGKLYPAVGGGIRVRTSEHVMARAQLGYGFPDGVQLFFTLGSGT